LYFAVALHAQVVTSEAMLALNVTVPISSGQFNDLVNLSGSMHLVTQVASPDSPPIGLQTRFRVITTLVNVTGTGLITGLQYHATGTSIFASPNPPPIFPDRRVFTGSYQVSPTCGPSQPAPFLDGAVAPCSTFATPELSSAQVQGSVGLAPNGQIVSANVLQDALVSWWQAEGNANDAMGVNNGTNEGASFIPSGRVGQAFGFPGIACDGCYGDVLVPDSPSLGPATVTVTAWVNNNVYPGPNRYVVSKGAQYCVAASYALYTSTQTQNLLFGVFDGINFAHSPDLGPSGVWDGNWHFVAGTFDGAFVRLYVDGVEVGPGTPAGLSFIINYNLPTHSNFYIGSYVAPGWCTLPFNGGIDEVKVFRRALSASEIQSIYQQTP
jgi:hypothetical protein